MNYSLGMAKDPSGLIDTLNQIEKHERHVIATKTNIVNDIASAIKT